MKPVVLVVDDGAAIREMIRSYLSQIDCDVRLAEDGPTALAMIEVAPPDLVLLDVRMPRMDGYEVCRRIKAMPRGRLLPVVMITGLSQTTHRIMALEAGADDFMAKPVEGAELIARVRSALRLKELYNTLDALTTSSSRSPRQSRRRTRSQSGIRSGSANPRGCWGGASDYLNRSSTPCIGAA